LNIEISNPELSDLNPKTLENLVIEALGYFGVSDFALEIDFVKKEEIAKLNAEHRRKDTPTDVLSFPQIEIRSQKTKVLGNIVICREICQEKGEKTEDVIKHGLLHLLGYDHEGDEAKWQEAANKINCQL
jgi:probable rRNA maturation factor